MSVRVGSKCMIGSHPGKLVESWVHGSKEFWLHSSNESIVLITQFNLFQLGFRGKCIASFYIYFLYRQPKRTMWIAQLSTYRSTQVWQKNVNWYEHSFLLMNRVPSNSAEKNEPHFYFMLLESLTLHFVFKGSLA